MNNMQNSYALSLEEVLSQAISCESDSLHLYTCANNKARDEMPTVNSIQMTCRLMHEKGPRWRQTLLRQAVKDYNLVFRTCHGVNLAMGVLAETANYNHQYVELDHIALTMFHELKNNSQQFWFVLNELIKNIIEYSQKKPSRVEIKKLLLGTISNMNRLTWQKIGSLLDILMNEHFSVENKQKRRDDEEFIDAMKVGNAMVMLFYQGRKVSQRQMKGLLFCS